MAGRHAKRFIIEVKATTVEWVRSGNDGLTARFSTREEAQAALDPEKGFVSEGCKYRVRMK